MVSIKVMVKFDFKNIKHLLVKKLLIVVTLARTPKLGNKSFPNSGLITLIVPLPIFWSGTLYNLYILPPLLNSKQNQAKKPSTKMTSRANAEYSHYRSTE